MSYAILESRGLSCIADGREFVTVDSGIGDWPPPPTKDNNPYTLSVAGISIEPELIVPVSDETPLACEDCDRPLDRVLISHSAVWMYSAFKCDFHPLDRTLIDIFPKVDPDMSQDWQNAYEDPSRLFQQPYSDFNLRFAGSLVLGDNASTTQHAYQATVRYLLTPAGTEPVEPVKPVNKRRLPWPFRHK